MRWCCVAVETRIKCKQMLNEESAFQFKSVFKYSKLPTSDEWPERSPEQPNLLQTLIRNLIILFVFILVLLTLPFSLWFCLKKVKCMERCIVYRLGKRLPLRGPGLMVTLPCIDVIDFIDLKTHKFNVAENEHLLTADGSIVECKEFYVEVSVANALKSFTQLKDSKYNVEQFIKVSFSNLVGSNHVEDIERKPDFIFKQFIENCNEYVNNWGWNVSFIELPKIRVVQRAEPKNPLVSALKGYFGVQETNENEVNYENVCHNPRSNGFADDLIVPLQLIAKKYSSVGVLGYDVVNVALCIKDINQTHVYQFLSKTGKIAKLEDTNGQKIHLTIIAANVDDLLQFLHTQDTSKVEIKTSLF